MAAILKGSVGLVALLRADLAISSPLLATLLGATGTPSLHLGFLSLSATEFQASVPASGTINNATEGSTITASGLPTGLTIDGPARTWAWDGTGTPATAFLTLTETLAGADNTPRDTVIGYTIDAAPASGVPALIAGGEPYLVENYTEMGTPTTDLIIGREQFLYFGNWTESPDEVDWWVYDDATDTLLESGTTTYQGASVGYFGDELVGEVLRVETLARNEIGDAAARAVSTLTWTVQGIGPGNTIDPDPVLTFSRTTASGETPMGVSIAYNTNVRDGYTRRWNRYEDSAKSILLSTAAHILTWEDLQPGAVIDLDAELGAYDATDFIETGIEVTSPAAVWHQFLYPTALSPTDAVVPMVWSATDKSGGMTLSGGNLVITQVGAPMDAIRGSRSVDYDKTYFEVTAGIQYTEIGVADTAVALPAPNYWGATAFGQVATDHAAGWHGNDTQLYYNNTFTSIGSFGAADVIGVAYDRVAEKIWFRKNGGSWLPSGDPAAGTGGHSVPGIDAATARPFVLAGGGSTITGNFGTTPGGTAGFSATPPTGFVAP